jgi:signal transduction histidine kinase
MKKDFIFKPRARLLLQLGNQLIRNESIALLELIKNSYDADASRVKVVMKNVDDPEKGVIVIEDNGCGMTAEIIKNVWMEPGSDYKEKLVKENRKTPKFGRLPLGEKGIGRFAVHKLGNLIELTTRSENNPEIYLTTDWTVFEKSRYLEEVPVKIIEKKEAEYFTNKTGTKITIKKLKNIWARGMVRDIYRSLNSFSSPFDTPESFRIEFEIDKKDWIKGLLSWEEIKDYALFRFKCELEGGYIKKFRYEFTPWPTMTKLEGRIVDENNEYIRKQLRMVDSKHEDIDLNKYKIGPVKFEGFIFDRESRILSIGVQDKQGLKKYLDPNGGIRVYRDGIRVYDYGEPGNDWLGLDIRRVNIPAKRVSNNIIIATVYLERDKSTDLIEKTNREGFIENDALRKLERALIYCLEQVEGLRYEDKDKIRTVYGLKSKKEPVVSGIRELRKIVDKRIKEDSIKKEIDRYLGRVEKEYEEMKEILLKSAGAGLTLSVVIHEIDKIIAELKKVVEHEKVSDRIIGLIHHLSNLVEGYSIIIKKSETKRWDLKKLIDQAVFDMEYRFRVHKIKVVKKYEKYPGRSDINCARNLVINSLINIMDNSIWWLEYWYKEKKTQLKKIYLNISENIPGYISVVIADNGPGLTLPPEEVIKPFVSAKPDGMGLGLHIANEIMKAHKGMLLFPDADEFEIPEEFGKGAIVVLAFKKEREK